MGVSCLRMDDTIDMGKLSSCGHGHALSAPRRILQWAAPYHAGGGGGKGHPQGAQTPTNLCDRGDLPNG